ncbi:MAG: chemotaxis protein CheB [Gemmatimonadaceae bacterium]
MVTRDIIVIGASAGGVEALLQLAAGLPSDLGASLFVTVHFPRTSESVLPQLLNRAGPLPALHPGDGDRIERHCIYVAPPDRHLLVMSDDMRLSREPVEHGHRPAIDPMFRSAALAHGNRVIGVVLSGNQDDGTTGMQAIVTRGGVGVAQDPDEAMYPSMPGSTIAHGMASHVVALGDMTTLLLRLVGEEVPGAATADKTG